MIDIIFPKILPSNSNVVIYGENITGYCFFEQIRSVKHCNVIAFIDKAVGGNPYGIPAYSPEWLAHNGDKYDYVLIGTLNAAAVSEIADTLKSKLLIGEDRIICKGYRPFLMQSGMADIDNPAEIADMLRQFGKNAADSEKSINYIVSVLSDNKENMNGLIQAIKELYYEKAGFKTTAVCAYILFMSGCGDKEIFQDFYRQMKSNAEKYPEWVYIMAFNVMAGVTLRCPDFCYRHYYTDVREIIDKCASKLYSVPDRQAAMNKNRVAICANTVFGAAYHLTGIISNLANWLNRNGYEVAVFIESKCYGGGEFFADGRCFGGGIKTEVYAESNKNVFDEEVALVYNEGNTLTDRINNHLRNVIEYAPDRIVYYQEDCTCATRILYDMFPILSIPTVSSLASSGYHHCIACPDKQYLLELNTKYPWTECEDSIVEYRGAMIPAPDVLNERKRSDYGWKESDFIVITVGNRMQYDLSPEFSDVVCSELKRDSELKWVIVGTASDAYIQRNYAELVITKQIEFVRYESNLMELYRLIDVYVNPDRLGGGTTIAWAMLSGLPVLTNDIGSAGRLWIGKENCTHGYNDMMMRLRRLKTDVAFNEKQSELMKEKALEYSVEAASRRILDITELSIKRFKDTQID